MKKKKVCCSKVAERLFFLTMISPNLQLKWAPSFPSSRRIFRHNCLRTEPPSSTWEHLRRGETSEVIGIGRSVRGPGSVVASPEGPAARLGAPAQRRQVAHQRMSLLQDVWDGACHCRDTTGCMSDPLRTRFFFFLIKESRPKFYCTKIKATS